MCKFLYTDDKTGKFSDTTLRIWLLFMLFFVYAILLAIIVLLFVFRNSEDYGQNIIRFATALELLQILGIFALGGGALYLGKRVNDRYSGPVSGRIFGGIERNPTDGIVPGDYERQADALHRNQGRHGL